MRKTSKNKAVFSMALMVMVRGECEAEFPMSAGPKTQREQDSAVHATAELNPPPRSGTAQEMEF